jgi:4,5-DOPA dioxygenase extradiol
MPMPTLFLSHGSPMLVLEDEPSARFLRDLSKALPKPSSMVVVSAHWETAAPMITGLPHPETIHDFYGFPKELYELRYHVPGNPLLARQIQTLLTKAGFEAAIDSSRGLDHGVWDPLMLMYPAADIPVLELSIQPGRDARWHYRVGEALASLRDENVLIIGSGNLTHNLREAFRGHHRQPPAWVTAFAEWIADKVKADDVQSLLDWRRLAPHAQQNHPTPEHFLPFFVACGAAKDAPIVHRLNKETAMGVLAMDAYMWDARTSSFGGCDHGWHVREQ